MPAYVIANIEVTDPEGYQQYRSRSLATVEQFGGRFIVRGGEHEVKEGDWQPHRVILLEFPDLATARTWYDSEAYQSIIPYRANTAKTQMVLVDGMP